MESIKASPRLERKPISAGYTKRGELATEEDAVILGLHPNDAEKIFICDRDKNFAMFHFRDFEVSKSVTIRSSAAILRVSPDDGLKSVSSTESLLPSNLFSSSPSPPPNSTSPMRVSPESLNSSVESTANLHDQAENPHGYSGSEDHLLVRGWIVDIDTNTVVCRSFSESSVVFVNPENFQTDSTWTDYSFKPFREGTTIRIFWDQVQWRLSTHRKIDASTSRIPGVEVEVSKIFAEACPGFSYDLLSKDVIYVLQIVHRDNQIMNPQPVEVPYVCHLASIGGVTHVNPMQLLPIDTDSSLRLDCFTYLEPLNRQTATELLAMKSCIIAQRGYEIIQVAPQSIQKLMEVRGHDKAPYIPVGLMYLRLSEEDRPLLVQAVPYHLKPLVTTEVMQAYIQEHSHKLAHFCACALQAKLFATGLPLTKTLKWLVDGLRLPNKNVSFEEIYHLYRVKIDKLVAVNGMTAYRCFRDVEDTSIKLLKMAAKESSRPSAPDRSDADPSIVDGKQPKAPSRSKGNYKNKNRSVKAKPSFEERPKRDQPVKKPTGPKKPMEKRAPIPKKPLPPKPSAKGLDRRIAKKEYVVGTDPDEEIGSDLVNPSKPRTILKRADGQN
jgi:hypothetical protein